MASKELELKTNDADDDSFRVTCGEKDFLIPKSELVSESMFFSALCNSSMKETVTNHVHLQNIEPHIFEMVLNYLKDGTVPHEDLELLKTILVAAEYLQINRLANDLGNAIVQHVNDENVISLKEFSACSYNECLKDKIDEYLAQRLTKFITMKVMLELLFDDFKKLLCHSNSKLCSNDLISCLLVWIKHHETSRRQHIHVLLEINLSTLCNDFCLDILQKEPLMRSEKKVEEFLLTKITEKRRKLLLFSKRCAQVFMLSHRIWCTIEIPVDISKHTIITCFNQSVFFFGTGLKDGGWNWSRKLTDSFRYHTTTRFLKKVAPMPISVYDGRGTVMGDKIYVAGAHLGKSKRTTIIQVFSPCTNSWEVLPESGIFHHCPEIVAFDNCIYIANCKDKISVEKFDLETEQWQTLSHIEDVEFVPKPSTDLLRRLPFEHLLLCDQKFEIVCTHHLATCNQYLYILRTYLKVIPNFGLPSLILKLELLRYNPIDETWVTQNLTDGPKSEFYFVSGYKSSVGMIPYFIFYEPDRLKLHEFYPAENKWNSYTTGWSIIQNVVKYVLIS